MKFISLATLTTSLLAAGVMANNVAFNVASFGTECGHGMTVGCQLSHGQSCKGNFDHAQQSVVVTQSLSNCHISLYPQNNQQGGVIQRVKTDYTGQCVYVYPGGEYKSYGIYC